MSDNKVTEQESGSLDRSVCSASVVVDTSAPTRPYNRMIFGGFLEHFDSQIYGGVFEPGSPLSDEQGFRLDVIEAIKELKVPIIRWPGGCFVDSYHWQKGVGPNREPYGDFRWGVIEPNTFGTHEFVELCRRIGAEPYICHNGMADPQENVDWVDYCNAAEGPLAELRKANGYPEPLNVQYWSVGNERSDRDYIDRVRDTAWAMKASDPSVQIMASATHGEHVEINEYLFEEAAQYLDLASIHNYWLDRGQKLICYSYLDAMMKSEMPERYIADAIAVLRRAGQLDRLKISFDEWNLRAWQHPGFPRNSVDDYEDPEVRALVDQRRQENDLAEQYTMADALFSASFLNSCLRNCEHVTMAAVAPLVNTRGPLFVHPEGIVKRTGFHAMAMYANLLKERMVECKVDAESLEQGENSVATVDAIATCDGVGESWSIALINRHPSAGVSCELDICGRTLNGSYCATVLAADSPDAYNDIADPARVIPRELEATICDGLLMLPPHSLTVLRC